MSVMEWLLDFDPSSQRSQRGVEFVRIAIPKIRTGPAQSFIATDAGKPSLNSVEAAVRLLTPDNRRLLALIRDRTPESVAELAALTEVEAVRSGVLRHSHPSSI